MNKIIWNAGTTANPHPLETSWEDRFLIYPNDPNSGPLRKQESVCRPDKQKKTAVSPSPENNLSELIFSLRSERRLRRFRRRRWIIPRVPVRQAGSHFHASETCFGVRR